MFIIAHSVESSDRRRTIEHMAHAPAAPRTGADDSPDASRIDSQTGRVPAFARPTGFALWLMATALLGGAATFLLLYERVQLWNNPDHVTSCDVNPWVSCGEVMQTWQASTFGFPNIFIGVVAFPLVIAAAVSLLAVGGRMPTWYYAGLQAGATFALGFVAWLWYSAVYSIGVLCPYCMVVWAAVIPMFVVVTARNMVHGVLPVSAGWKRIAADWWWVAILVILLLVFASLLLNFTHAFTYGL